MCFAQTDAPATMRVDYSAVSQFARCPAKWALENKVGLTCPISEDIYLGSVIHKTMEVYHKAKDNLPPYYMELHELRSTFAHEWESGEAAKDRQGNLRQVEWKTPQSTLMHTGTLMLEAYYPWVSKVSPLLVEQKIEKQIIVDEQVVTVYGTIDLVTSHGIPVDLKTAGRVPYQTDIDANLQPTFYCYLLGGPSNFVYHYLVKGKVPTFQQVTTQRTQQDIDWLGRVIPMYVRAMQSGIYPPNRTNLCAYCGYREGCLSGKVLVLL